MRSFKLFILLAFLSACKNSHEADDKLTPTISIDIQPFDDIHGQYAKSIYNELSKNYPNIKIKKSIPLPKVAYYAPRNRYRADSLINFLRSITPTGHLTIGITCKDISDTKDTIKDYGIMGLGFNPGNACVVSCFRLSKENTLEQLFKLSMHELGHTHGLPHCPVKTCFMRDADGKNHLDEEKEFCYECRSYLNSKGWIIP